MSVEDGGPEFEQGHRLHVLEAAKKIVPLQLEVDRGTVVGGDSDLDQGMWLDQVRPSCDEGLLATGCLCQVRKLFWCIHRP